MAGAPGSVEQTAAATSVRSPAPRLSHDLASQRRREGQLRRRGEAPAGARDQQPFAGARRELARDAPGFVGGMAGPLRLAPEPAEVRVEEVVQASEVLATDDRVQAVARPELLSVSKAIADD